MSPVNPDKIKSIKPTMIDYDRPCKRCGYNLVGLMSDTKCPECGLAILGRNRNLPRYADNMVNAPISWLGTFSTGALVLFVASLGLFFATGAAAYLASIGYKIPAVIAGIFSVGWLAGVCITTRPRPQMKTTVSDPHREWALLRWSARVSQAFWCVIAACLFFHAQAFSGFGGGVTPHPILLWASLPAFAVAALGMIPFCALVSNLAYWASDSNLAEHFRKCAWTVGFTAFLVGLYVINGLSGARILGPWAGLLFGLLIVFVVVPWFYMIFCCFQLQGVSRWALVNHAVADAKTQRLIDRAKKESARPVQANIPVVEGVDMSAFDLGDSTVADQAPAGRLGEHVVKRAENENTPLGVDPIDPKRLKPLR